MCAAFEPDEYASDLHRWWHLSGPSPEPLQVLEAGSLGHRGGVLDPGCGPGSDLAYLAERSDIGEDVLRETFAGWRWLSQSREELASDTRTMPALVARIERPL